MYMYIYIYVYIYIHTKVQSTSRSSESSISLKQYVKNAHTFDHCPLFSTSHDRFSKT